MYTTKSWERPSEQCTHRRPWRSRVRISQGRRRPQSA